MSGSSNYQKKRVSMFGDKNQLRLSSLRNKKNKNKEKYTECTDVCPRDKRKMVNNIWINNV